MVRFFLAVASFMTLASAALPTASLAQAADPAVSTITELDAGLLRTMRAGGSTAARGRVIAPVLERAFDLPLMTRLAVGPEWVKLSGADQQALVDAFKRMTIAEYARNFDSFSGETFEVSPKVETRGGDKVVRTTLKVPKGAPVAIAYRLRQGGGAWRIIDVFYNNAISQIATRRSDFGTVLQNGGAKALVARMNAIAAKGGS
ncbi:ABC transporter substrate-binding protein [Novosphingobium sp.]|uniref:ABC transporter substrate-binding protein n=1 Tax=Novosphingobium sp. TaxID=1874826 RepID=UPI003BAB805B